MDSVPQLEKEDFAVLLTPSGALVRVRSSATHASHTEVWVERDGETRIVARGRTGDADQLMRTMGIIAAFDSVPSES